MSDISSKEEEGSLPVIPQGWVWTNFEEIGIVNPRSIEKEISDDADITFIPMRCVNEMGGGMDVSNVRKYIEVKKGYTPFIEGDLLVAKITPCMENGKVVIADKLKNGVGYGSTEFHNIRLNKDISTKLFFFFFLRTEIRKDAQRHMTGTAGQLRVPSSFIQNLRIPLPPLPEQHRIVTKIEELLSQLDAGVASLKKVQAQLKRYRQAVLKAAFEGRLTQEWREEHNQEIEPAYVLLNRINPIHAPDAIKNQSSSRSSDTSQLTRLPEEWMWTTLDSISLKITDGEHFSPKGEITGIPFLSAKDVRDNKLSFENPIYINEDEAVRCRKRCNPEKGDILVVSRGATVGRCCKIETDQPFCLLGSVILIKAKKQLSSDYLLYALKSQVVHKQLINISGSTAQQAIYLRDIKKSFIPLCSQQEMKGIVAEIERYFSQIDHLEKTIETNLRLAETLRQSILKRAFEGNLVQQDPIDEPASILLERIKAEKVKTITRMDKGKRVRKSI